MSNLSKQFTKYPVEISNRNGSDKSHETLGTASIGTLVPVMWDEIFPNDKFSLGITSEINLPPMATNFFGRVDVCFESFFVPYRIILAYWKKFYTQDMGQQGGASALLPDLSLSDAECKAGTLADYLGYRSLTEQAPVSSSFNILPFLAYHKIWDDWYRDSRLQVSCFSEDAVSGKDAANLPFTNNVDGVHFQTGGTGQYKNTVLNDGKKLGDLRQRNYTKDYFTTATTDPQAGIASKVTFPVRGDVLAGGGTIDAWYNKSSGDVVAGSSGTSPDVHMSGGFTIATLRAANALQRYFERQNIAGDRYPDRILANWGCLPSDAITDRAIFLDRVKRPIICHSVVNPQSYQSKYDEDHESYFVENSSSNPMASLAGSSSGKMSGFSQGSLGQFHAKEHGIVMVMMSVVPHSYYGSGFRRQLMGCTRSHLADFPNSIMAGIGDQEIWNVELYGESSAGLTTFGYQQRFSETKWIEDSVHSLLVDGRSMSAFALKRSFTSDPSINSSFIEIPKTALDDVLAVKSVINGNPQAQGISFDLSYGYTYDCGISYKYSSCLPAFCVPTLDTQHDVHTIMVDNGGRRF